MFRVCLYTVKRIAAVSILGISSMTFAKVNADCDNKRPLNVIVFGFSRTGKTTLLNALTSENHLVGENGTFELDEYKPIQVKDKLIKFVDTRGMFGTGDTVVPAADAEKMVTKLSTDYSNIGVSLLVYVRRDGGQNVLEEGMIRQMQSLFPGVPMIMVNNFMNTNEKASYEFLQKHKLFEKYTRATIPASNLYSVNYFNNYGKIKQLVYEQAKEGITYTGADVKRNQCNFYVIALDGAQALCPLLLEPSAAAICWSSVKLLSVLLRLYCYET